MQIGVDKDGTRTFCPYYLRRGCSDDGFEEWYGTAEKPGEESHAAPFVVADERALYYSTKEFWPDGTATHEKPYYFVMHEVELPDEFKSLTWDDDAVDVEVVRDDESGNLWLARDKDGSLCLFFVQPHRNSMHPWWSAPDKMILEDTDEFGSLTWDNEPIKVKFRIKK